MRFWLSVLIYVSVASIVWMLMGFLGLDKFEDFWLMVLFLLFVIGWVSVAVIVIVALLSLMKRLLCKVLTKLKSKKDVDFESLNKADNPPEIIAEFKGFGDWVSSVPTIKCVLSVMQHYVDCALEQGYVLKEVAVWGGVQEADSGYEIFSHREYACFADAVARLPAEFKSVQKKLRKVNKCIKLNFEGLTVVFVKDGNLFELTFRAGKLYATEGLGLYFR